MFLTNALDNVGNAYVDEDTGTSTPGTRLEADDRNIIQDELENAIEGTGQTLDASGIFTNNDQLLKAILSVSSGISGLIISNNSGSPDTHIDISIGNCLDSTKTALLKLPSSTIKDLSAIYAAGSGNGGLYQAGGLAVDETYHAFLMQKDSDKSIDVYVDISVTGINIPAGHTALRKIGSVLTDGSADILGFKAVELSGGAVDYTLNVSPLDIALATLPNATRNLVPMSSPLGIETIIKIRSSAEIASTAHLWIRSTFAIDVPASISEFTHQTRSVSSVCTLEQNILTDTSAQIAYRGSGTGFSLNVQTIGWIDRRVD